MSRNISICFFVYVLDSCLTFYKLISRQKSNINSRKSHSIDSLDRTNLGPPYISGGTGPERAPWRRFWLQAWDAVL